MMDRGEAERGIYPGKVARKEGRGGKIYIHIHSTDDT